MSAAMQEPATMQGSSIKIDRPGAAGRNPRSEAIASANAVHANEIADEDEHRAAMYMLFGRLLYSAPSDDLLEQVRGMEGDDTEFGQAVSALAESARANTRQQVEEEFEDLFIGLPQAQLMPYASYYITGGLFGRPLAQLRMTMAEAGIARNPRATEPEDHIAPVCEMMAGLIMGAFAIGPASLKQQHEFFDSHVSRWVKHFFSDLESAEGADFYAYLARVALLFLELEREAFSMAQT